MSAPRPGKLPAALEVKQLQVLVESFENAEVPGLGVVDRLAPVAHLVYLLQLEARYQDGRDRQRRVRVLAPEPIDEALLNEVVDVLAVLNQQDY